MVAPGGCIGERGEPNNKYLSCKLSLCLCDNAKIK